MKKFLARSALFLLPVAIIYAAEIFAAPIGKFCYRPLESLLVYKLNILMSGHLYPEMDFEMTGQGDQGYYTSLGIRKKERWITDVYGYRNRGAQNEKYDVVVLGDSFTLCPGVTQDNILSEALEKKTGLNVYPMATRYMQDFLVEERFRRNPPKYLVLQRVEDNMNRLKPAHETKFLRKEPVLKSRRARRAAIVADRVLKSVFFRYLRSETKRVVERKVLRLGERLPLDTAISDDGKMLFIARSINSRRSLEYFDSINESLVGYDRMLKRMKIHLIVLPVPSKVNIYPEKMAAHKDGRFIEKLNAKMTDEGIDFVDAKGEFLDARKRGEDLFFADDSHWNENGIDIASTLLAEKMKDIKK